MAGEPGLRLVPSEGGVDVDALVGQVARGDAQAFGQLYDELSAAVYGLARRVGYTPRHLGRQRQGHADRKICVQSTG